MASLAEKALEFREKAKTNEKPKLTCWKPKFRKAAENYCRAAQLNYQVNRQNIVSLKTQKFFFTNYQTKFYYNTFFFLQVGNEEEAKSDLISACDCYKKKRAWFSAAKALEQVITICLDKRKYATEVKEESAISMLTSKVIEQGPLSAAYQETMGCFIPPKEVSALLRVVYNDKLSNKGLVKFNAKDWYPNL